MQVQERHARLVMLPAYVAHYQYGTRIKQGTHGVIVPQMFHAIIGGTKEGESSRARHTTALSIVGAYR